MSEGEGGMNRFVLINFKTLLGKPVSHMNMVILQICKGSEKIIVDGNYRFVSSIVSY